MFISIILNFENTTIFINIGFKKDANFNTPQMDLLFSFKNIVFQRLTSNQDKIWNNSYYFVIRNIVFLMFMLFKTNLVKWDQCTEDVFPIVHGNYYSKIDDSFSFQSEFEYCHAESFDLVDMNVYSNDDILITYRLIIVNGPQIQVIDQQIISVLARLGHSTGKNALG